MLEAFTAREILCCRFGLRDGRSGAVTLGQIVIVLYSQQYCAGFDHLVIVDQNLCHIAGDFGTDCSDVCTHISVVRPFAPSVVFPPRASEIYPGRDHQKCSRGRCCAFPHSFHANCPTMKFAFRAIIRYGTVP